MTQTQVITLKGVISAILVFCFFTLRHIIRVATLLYSRSRSAISPITVLQFDSFCFSLLFGI